MKQKFKPLGSAAWRKFESLLYVQLEQLGRRAYSRHYNQLSGQLLNQLWRPLKKKTKEEIENETKI